MHTGSPAINVEGIRRDVIAVGASAGGIAALTGLLPTLPANLPASIAIVLHRRRSGANHLVAVLGRHARILVVEPRDGESIEHGIVYVAPRDRHMLLEEGFVRLDDGPEEHRARPAIDPLFRSASTAYGARVVGVVLSGLGSDGAAGLSAIRQCGGVSLIQTPQEAHFSAMPSNAIRYDRLDGVDAVLSVDALSTMIQRLAAGEAVSRPAA